MPVKKTILLLCLSLSICGYSLAQDTTQSKKSKLSISAGYGYWTLEEFSQKASGIIGTEFLQYNNRIAYDNVDFTGAFIIGAKFSSRRWKYGIDVAFENFSKEVYDFGYEPYRYLGNSKVNYWGVVPRVDYYWFNKRVIRVYSGIAVGVSFMSEKFQFEEVSQNWIGVSLNIVPLGFEIGNTFSIYGESSLGMNGLAHGGIRIKL